MSSSKGETLIYMLSGSAMALGIVNWGGTLQALLYGIVGGFGGWIGRWLFEKVRTKILIQISKRKNEKKK